MNMANTFNPAAWLASFEAVGGAYAFNGERLHLWIVDNGQEREEVSTAMTLVIQMGPDNRASLAEHLRATALVEA
jgi:hypothetical protein